MTTWVDNVKEILQSPKLIPCGKDTIEEQLNSLTRLALLLLILSWIFFNPAYSYVIMGFAAVLFIIVYYIKKMNVIAEPFHGIPPTTPKPTISYQSVARQPVVENYENENKSQDCCGVNQNLNYVSRNASLIGCANKRTFVKPVMKPRLFDPYWQENQAGINSHINDESNQDLYLSGYLSSTCQPTTPGQPCQQAQVRGPVENYQPHNRPVENYQPRVRPDPIPVENYQPPTIGVIHENEPGWVNTGCGYNANNIENGLPTNQPAGFCQNQPELAEYNHEMYTTTLEPNMYATNEIIEPISSTIGSTFQQQHLPIREELENGAIHYTYQDPRLVQPAENIPLENYDELDSINQANVYDPRFYGYGSSNRSYIDPMTGQPRFVYDDINAVRMPNYITRNKIDHLSYANKYGPVPDGHQNGNPNGPMMRKMVQQSWFDQSQQYRNYLTQQRMNKANQRVAQMRRRPIGPWMN